MKKIIVTKYVPHGLARPSGHIAKCAGYPSRRISYNYGERDPGQAAAQQYVRDVILPELTTRVRKHKPQANVLFMVDRTESYSLPGQMGKAHVVTFLYPGDEA